MVRFCVIVMGFVLLTSPKLFAVPEESTIAKACIICVVVPALALFGSVLLYPPIAAQRLVSVAKRDANAVVPDLEVAVDSFVAASSIWAASAAAFIAAHFSQEETKRFNILLGLGIILWMAGLGAELAGVIKTHVVKDLVKDRFNRIMGEDTLQNILGLAYTGVIFSSISLFGLLFLAIQNTYCDQPGFPY